VTVGRPLLPGSVFALMSASSDYLCRSTNYIFVMVFNTELNGANEANKTNVQPVLKKVPLRLDVYHIRLAKIKTTANKPTRPRNRGSDGSHNCSVPSGRLTGSVTSESHCILVLSVTVSTNND
jgi:hypothetical protein